MLYDRLSVAEKHKIQTSTKMAVSCTAGVIHYQTAPTPPSSKLEDWLTFSQVCCQG